MHRLDRDTSGVLLVAKKRAALIALHAPLREGRIDKRYLVLVRATGATPSARSSCRCTKFVTARASAACGSSTSGGQAATTVFFGSASGRGIDPPLSLLEAELQTGRTHQIRVHLTHLGFPLAGDDKYGDFAWNKAARQAGPEAHVPACVALAFAHPLEERESSIESHLPPDLDEFVAAAGCRRRAMMPEPPRRFRLLVFDWDGTLADSTALIAGAIRQACVDVGVAGARRDRCACTSSGSAMRDALRHVAPTLRRGSPRAVFERYRHHYLARDAEIPLFAGVREMLDELDARGFLLAVATGKTRSRPDARAGAARHRGSIRRHALRRRGLSQAHIPTCCLR